MKREELIEKLKSTDPEKVKDYLDVLDRIFLQAIVYKMLDPIEIENIINYWQKQIKSEINLECGSRNDFLMGTAIGRVLSHTDEVEDGESMRLSNLKAVNVAKEIAFQNYIKK
jgi:hypothetical protein